jgi:hypothetical protein
LSIVGVNLTDDPLWYTGHESEAETPHAFIVPAQMRL